MIRLIKHWLAIFGVSALTLGGERCGLIYVDWELVLALASGIATIGVLFLEHRRANRFEELAVEHAERIATLEAQAERVTPEMIDALAERMTTLEAVTAGEQSIGQRVASLEAQPECSDDVASLRERVSAIEARIDFKPITHTRGAKGKFVSPDAASCEDPKK